MDAPSTTSTDPVKDPRIAALKRRAYEILDGLAEKIPLSFAIYERGGPWPKLYHDAGADTLCGFARRANPTSGRCRDDEQRMVGDVMASGKAARSACWQGTMRWVLPVVLDGQSVLAVAVCGFGVDPKAREADYLPQDMAEALGLGGERAGRAAAFPGDAMLPPAVADGVADLLGLVLSLLPSAP